MNENIDNKVKEAEESAEKNSPQNSESKNPWAELQQLLEQMEMDFPGGKTDAPIEEKAVQDSQVNKTDATAAKPIEGKAEKAELNDHIKRGEAVVEQFQNELRQSLLQLTNTLAEKGMLDKRTARKHRKRVKRDNKLRLRELKKKMREIKKNGSQ